MANDVDLLSEYEVAETPDLTAEFEPPARATKEETREAMIGALRASAPNLIEGFIREKLLTTGGAGVDTAIQVGVPIASTIAGAASPLPGGAAAGGATGAAAADLLVQGREAIRGERSELSPGRTVAAAAFGAIPVGKATGGLVRMVARRAGEGAVLGAGQEATASLIDEGKIDWGNAITSGAIGTVIGGGAGGLENLAPKVLSFFRGLGKKTPAETVEAITETIEKTEDAAEKAQLTEIQKRIQQMVGLDDRELAPATFVGVQEGIPEAGIPNVELFNVNRDVAGTVEGSTVARQTLENAGFRVPPVPEVKPGSRVDIPLTEPTAADSAAVFQEALDANTTPQAAEGLREQLRRQEILANDFQRARFEEAGEELRARQLGGDETVVAELQPLPPEARVTMWRMGSKEAVQIDIPNPEGGRPLFSGTPEQARAEGYDVQLPRWMDEGTFTYEELKPGKSTLRQGQETGSASAQQPEVAGEAVGNTGLNRQEQQALSLSPQAQRIYDQYGFIDAALLRGLTASGAGVAGGGYGLTQGETAEERVRNGLTYAVIGAGGGYMAGSAFRRALLNQTPKTGNANLDRWYKRLKQSEEKPDWKERIRSLPNVLRRELTTGAAPVDRLPQQLKDANANFIGPLQTTRQHIPLSRQFELVNGASGKAAVDVEDYAKSVLSQVKDEEMKDFNVLLALKRTGQRLEADATLAVEQARIQSIPANQRTPKEVETSALDPNRRRVAGETLDTVDDALRALQTKLGPQRFNQLDQLAAGAFQQEADKALRVLVASGRMSQEQYNAIKTSNDFYAPFRVMEAAEQFDGFKGAKVNPIDTQTKYTQAITGIDDPNFTLDDPAKVLGEKIYQARILAEKNLKMRVLADLATEDPSGTVVRKLADREDAPRGMEVVNYFDNGVPSRLAVSPEVAGVVKGMNPAQTGIIARFVQAVNKPFRFGATAGNIGFQAVNAPFDQARLALMSKYGAGRGSMVDTLRYPTDFVHALYSSIIGNRMGPQAVGAVGGFYGGYMAEDDPENKLQSALLGGAAGLAGGAAARRMVGPNDLYRKFYESGAAGSTLQDMIERISTGKTATDEVRDNATGVIRSLQDFGKVIEETTKIMGFKRGLRIEGIDKLPPAQAAKKLEEVVSEVRNFAGSPDFSVSGNMVRDLNAAVVFLNPRIQGMAEDFGRLGGRDGAKAAAQAWTALASTAGIGSAMLWASNQRPENVEDFEKVSPEERNRYGMIPRYNEDGTPMYFTNDRGQKVREYWRVPLRDTTQSMYQLVQSSLDFAKKEDPDAAKGFAAQLLENLSPINVTGKNSQERMESFISGFGPVGTIPYMVATGRNPGLHREIVLDPNQRAGSKENQFTTTTPEVYKRLADAAPQWLADPLRSPLMLQEMTQTATGGVFNQFTPPKPLADRDPSATALQQSPLGRRFVRSTYVHSDVPEPLEQAVTQQYDEKATATRDTRALFDELRALPRDQRVQRLQTLAPEQQSALMDEAKRRSRRPTDNEIAQIKVLNVENGARATYITSRLRELPAAERVQFLQDLNQAGLLSENVTRQIQALATQRR